MTYECEVVALEACQNVCVRVCANLMSFIVLALFEAVSYTLQVRRGLET